MPGLLSKTHVAAGMVVRRAAPELRIGIELKNPVTEHLPRYARANLALAKQHGLGMVGPAECKDQKLALCGAGPSLRPDTFGRVDKLWACNSALPHLVGLGVHVDAGIGIDQTPGLQREWSAPPDVTYYLASTCDPELVKHLLSHERRIRFFHNAVGFDGEKEHYDNEWMPGFMVGHGATVVCRTIGLAEWQGFERVDVHGADCAFGDDDRVHANGDGVEAAYGKPVVMQGSIDGRSWRTRPDMLMEAVNLARRARHAGGRVRLMGDTLPVALLGKTDEVLDLVMRRLNPGELPEGT